MDQATVAILTSMLLAGLAGSLHCVGMCGPILLGFSQTFSQGGKRTSLVMDFAGYHAGRIWTYMLMGFAAGLLGEQMRHGSAAMGWQQGIGIALAAAVALSGVAMLGVIPGFKLEHAAQCGVKRFGALPWFRNLIHGQGVWPRVMLGVIMGFLPCGLVWAMLVVSASMPSPWHGALGMMVFGIGTLPSLSAVIGAAKLLNRKLSPKWRAQGGRLAAVMLILTGGWMVTRSMMSHEHCAEGATSGTMSPCCEHGAAPGGSGDGPSAAPLNSR
ncbi:MAG: sulfite exporter TauE/SafE family protein [Phycisphaeraceae bacterium]|nr:sulfite exporter TauE/SafE family protein [Phycisphaeraceae bacterium]